MPPGIALVGRVREALGLPGPMSVEGYELMGKDWRFSSEKTERELGYAARPIAETLKATVDSNLELIEAEPLKGREPRRYPRSPRSRCPRRSRSRCFSRHARPLWSGARSRARLRRGDRRHAGALDELSEERQLPLVG